MNAPKRFAIGLLIAGAGVVGAAGVAGTGHANAQIDVCGSLPGQSTMAGGCEAVAGDTGLALSIAEGGGTAWAQADNYSGPAAIAIGPNSSVKATGNNPGLAIGIAGPGASIVIDGKKGPTCSGEGFAFAGDFQTLQGCWQ
ncbi:hypothetical protein GOHSU_05_00040 [Gordonia hirsuta DSM 44140 = NBRC 16056]|uniref:Protein kinase n=1 Tax=Gordonia hirsuta DSM 44140 = NBRC 16056 TaxID=1121927 RepID=L7L5E8_9ACTN|nr:DUF6764 family protein [Gordonia hirsuta]GAC56365.1 hypothetical protein GOHSU_05_00040 [Gordonia hirsuta DSM 44140 = NBRC 16056]